MADAETHMTVSSQETCVKFKYTTFETNFVVSDNNKQDDISLQEAFRRYKEAKQDELRQARLLRKRQELRKADPQKMAILRQKFLSQAKKYYGYPYARKYWPPDSREYKSKLFLDCCGLVRRVMRDLAEDFGFIIGPWNQAYMFDTLPVVVENEKDMKPGDLVFISATYYNPKSKKQRHNMTHVEIWAGEGPKTIGARWNNGKVQMWDHYKFLAKSYHSETYHFRSIDTWLKGICTSHCSQHSWRRSRYNPTKKSIFALPEQIEEDEAAGDDDDNVDTFNMRGNTFIGQVSSVNKMLAQCKISEIERPKTELDYLSVRNDSTCSKQRAAALQTGSPTIRNDKKGKGRNPVNKQKKVKSAADGKKKGSFSLEVTKYGGQEGSWDTNALASSEGIGFKNSLSDSKKEHGQMRISGSLNDLGRKGLYLKDLVDFQKTDNDVEDKEEDADKDNTEEEVLEDTEENDYDDDYFIFVNDDEDSDREQRANAEHSDDSSEFIMGEDIDSDNEIENEGKNAVTFEAENKTVVCSKESTVENTAMHENSGEYCNVEENVKADLVDEKQAISGCEKSKKQEWYADDTEHDMIKQTDTDSLFKAQSPKEDATFDFDHEEAKESVKVNIIETIIPFGPTEDGNSPSFRENENHENSNQSANPDVIDKHKSRENSLGQCLKASVITLVSQIGHSSSQPRRSVSSFWPSSSQGSSTSQPGLPRSEASSTSLPGLPRSQASSTSLPGLPRSQASSKSLPGLPRNETSSVPPFILPLESQTRNSLAKADSSQSQPTADLEISESSADLDGPSDTQNENNRTESGKKSGEKKSQSGTRLTKLPSSRLQINMPPTFFVCGGNGVALVEGPLTGLGWKRITNIYDERFKLKWVDTKSRINYNTFKEGDQLVNHLPNSHLLTNKLGLLNSLKEYERATLNTKGRLPRLRISDFHPETYNLDEKGDTELFLNVYKEDEIWICKPIGWNQGKGIFLIRSREAIDQIIEEREQSKKQPQKAFMSRIVQRYITNPLLLDGRKFDIRAYMLVASTAPFLILYHKGYVRLCCHKYDEDNTDLGRHLTNQFVQKKDPNYEKLKETTAWSMDKFNQYINEHVRPDCPVRIEEDWVYNTFTRQVQKIIIHCFNSVKHKLHSKIGYFDLYGLDFMVDTNMKVQLIEVNTNPCLACNCKALKEVIPGVVEETLYLAIECFEKSRKKLPLMPLQSLKNFTVLYCGSNRNSNTSSQSRSVTLVKESNSTEKPAFLRNLLSQRALSQSTPIYPVSRQRAPENSHSESNSSTVYKENKRSSHILPDRFISSGKSNRKKKFFSSAMSDGKFEKNDGVKEAKKSENAHTVDSFEKGDVDKKTQKNESEKDKHNPEVNGILIKPTAGLNMITLSPGVLPRIGQTQKSQNEIQLKMKYLNNSNSAKPTSAQSLRARESLERGN